MNFLRPFVFAVLLMASCVAHGQPNLTQQPVPNAGSERADSGPFNPGKNGVGYPTCVYCPAPARTEDARKAKFQGIVTLQVVVGPNGRASDIKVVKGVGYGLNDKAVEAVQSWLFKPALKDGKAVAVVTAIDLTFRKEY